MTMANRSEIAEDCQAGATHVTLASMVQVDLRRHMDA